MENSTEKKTLDTGCIFDCRHGQYIGGMIQNLAKAWGWAKEVIEDPYNENYGDAWEEAEQYLTQFAPEGYWVGSNENSDFGVWEDDEEQGDTWMSTGNGRAHEVDGKTYLLTEFKAIGKDKHMVSVHNELASHMFDLEGMKIPAEDATTETITDEIRRYNKWMYNEVIIVENLEDHEGYVGEHIRVNEFLPDGYFNATNERGVTWQVGEEEIHLADKPYKKKK